MNTKILDPKDPNTLDTAADIIRGGGVTYAVANRLKKAAGFHIVEGDKAP